MKYYCVLDIDNALNVGGDLSAIIYETCVDVLPGETPHVYFFEQPGYVFLIRDVIAFINAYPTVKFEPGDIRFIATALVDASVDLGINLYTLQHRILAIAPQCSKNNQPWKSAIARIGDHGGNNSKSRSENYG